MENWKKTLNEQNDKNYQWPRGWDTLESVALELECTPDKVKEIFSNGIKNGDIEMKTFKVHENGRVVKTVGLRSRPVGASNPFLSPNDGRLRKEFRFNVGDTIGNKESCGKVLSISEDVFKIEWDSQKVTTSRYKSLLKSRYKLIS